MYNPTVAQAHTFFVGQGQWLVHNQCPKIASPSPNGKLGGPAHQAEVNKLADQNWVTAMYGDGFTAKREFNVPTPGGEKSKRFVDVAILNPTKEPVEFFQVGVSTQTGLPVSRELAAIHDILSYSKQYHRVPITFVPYK